MDREGKRLGCKHCSDAASIKPLLLRPLKAENTPVQPLFIVVLLVSVLIGVPVFDGLLQTSTVKGFKGSPSRRVRTSYPLSDLGPPSDAFTGPQARFRVR